jgi:hypothetical protein
MTAKRGSTYGMVRAIVGLANLAVRQRRQERLNTRDGRGTFRLEALQSAGRGLLDRDGASSSAGWINFGMLVLSVMFVSLTSASGSVAA